MADTHKDDEGAPCLGTTQITFQDEKAEKKKKGLLAIFHVTEGGEESLRVSVLDGTSVYHGSIAMDQVKMKLLDAIDGYSERTNALAKYLLDTNNDEVSVKYSLQSEGRFKMAIRYQQKNEGGKTFKAWGGILDRNGDLFQFCQTIGACINQGQRELQSINHDMKVLQEERDNWKSTAEKLEGCWQKEKTTVLQNFVTLYNKTHEELINTKNELAATKLALDAQEIVPQPKKRGRQAKPKVEIEDDLPDQPDDYDNEQLDEEMVDALASRRPVDLTKRNYKKSTAAAKSKAKKTKTKQVLDSDDDETSSEHSTRKKKAKKPVAKVEETEEFSLFHVEDHDLFASQDGDQPAKKPASKRKKARQYKRKSNGLRVEQYDDDFLSDEDVVSPVKVKTSTVRGKSASDADKITHGAPKQLDFSPKKTNDSDTEDDGSEVPKTKQKKPPANAKSSDTDGNNSDSSSTTAPINASNEAPSHPKKQPKRKLSYDSDDSDAQDAKRRSLWNLGGAGS